MLHDASLPRMLEVVIAVTRCLRSLACHCFSRDTEPEVAIAINLTHSRHSEGHPAAA